MIKDLFHNPPRKTQPRTELFFNKIVQELVANKELNLHIRPDGSTKWNPEPDFKFVIIEKFLSVENEFTMREGLLLNGYFFSNISVRVMKKRLVLTKAMSKLSRCRWSTIR